MDPIGIPLDERSFRSQFVFKRTYNRPLDEEGTVFETFPQTIDRVIHHQRWLWETEKGRAIGEDFAPLTFAELGELVELRQLLLNREATVSGRTLWLGGTDVSKQFHATQFNPLRRSERFITSYGVKSFEDFEHGDVATVLTHTGKWKPATVSNAGIRKVIDVSFRRAKSVFKVGSSADHTWILKDGTRTLAKDLKVGDKVYMSPNLGFYDWDYDNAPVDEQYWWCYGFVFGDGTIAKSGNSVTSRVRLCGNKKDYLSRFVDCGFGYSYPPSCDKDPFVWTGSYLKTLPTDSSEVRMIRAFLHGYLAADGHKDHQSTGVRYAGICIKDPEAAQFVSTWAPVVGLYVLQDKLVTRKTNYGEIAAHELTFTTGQASCWTVDALEYVGEEECWCLTVDDSDHSFVLKTGIVTGNCSFGVISTVYDVVDAFHNLLLGVGVGFEPVPGIINGFAKEVEIEVIRSTRSNRGYDNNQEKHYKRDGKRVWRLIVGDSGLAWAKAVGKILAMKKPVDVVILDFSEVRPGGKPLRGFGWISSGDEQISEAFAEICKIMNRRAGQLLTRMDLLDVMNWLGTSLSSRRSAEIALFPADDPEAEEFAAAKKDYWTTGNKQRGQSNNSLLFFHKPTKREIRGLFSQMLDAGGSEPGFINGAAAKKRAPWFRGVNPCAEILLGDKSYCNLVTVNLAKFNGRPEALQRAFWIMGRANYRQTCVDFRDGILQDTWHELNQFLRLTGVGCAGIVMWEHHKNGKEIAKLREWAQEAAHSMADELGLPRSKAVTTVKPDGTVGKAMDTTEGIHKPLSKYIFNNIVISKASPLLQVAIEAGYRYFEHPLDPTSAVVNLPVKFEGVDFETAVIEGREVEVNLESAVEQLERYKLWMENYADHNVSITVSYSPDEVEQIVEWLYKNWDVFVGVSFLLRADPTKTAADLGYAYLPQQPVTKDEYYEYVNTLKPVDLDAVFVNSLEALEDDCATGACPIR